MNEPTEAIRSRLLTRAGIGSSIAVHIVILAWIVFGTGVRPFNPSPTEAIAVELVTPEQVQQASDKAKEKKKDTLTQLDLTIPKPTMQDDSTTKTASAQQTQAASAKPPAASKQPPPAQQQAAAQQPPAPPPQPAAPAAQSPPPQQATTFALNAPPVAQPDITEKYGTMFSLSDTGFSADTTAAKIEPSVVDTFREHLRKCSQMPASVTAADKVKIVLRIALSPAGNLMAAPALIEASASPKGPLLMQGAIKALQACQPYDMLPADKYKEWRILDLSFTPQDFRAG
ncbi:MAG: cell envelope biogenesis protein TolA [Xanthobacteraceae bacterium]|nr:cell envelope biogenesis protein TolA [Xanthobacteraceae bacterium]